ncbi:MAG: hypothetical protein RLZZ314_1284 [Bacteroidota bacterium]|jgi:hypothetical protein
MKGLGIAWMVTMWCLAWGSTAQTSVSGHVFDGETGQPLPFVNISFSGTALGTMTNTSGQYHLDAEGERVTKLVVSSLGYLTQTIPLQRGVPQVINVSLESRNVELGVAEVRPDKKAVNPAKPLMERVAEAKPNNDPRTIPALFYQYYDLQELAVNDFPERLPQRKFWGPFRWVWNHIDSTQSRVSLPLFVTESAGTKRTEGRRKEQRVEAARATWMQHGENTSSVQSEFLNIDLYQNQMLLLDRAFTSPLHDRGNVHYRYYLLDTLDRGGRPCFHLAFVPRRRGELTFEGDMWIDTLTLGLRHVEAKISEGANVNFVRSYAFSQSYAMDSGRWVLAREENLADISLREGGMGIYSHQTKVNRDVVMASTWPDSLWSSPRDISFAEGSHALLESTWQTIRPELLPERARRTYAMVDSIQSMRAYKFLEKFLFLGGTGYLIMGPVELGPWYDTFSTNAIEGDRWSLGIQTSNDFSRKVWLRTFAAYGTLDQRFKYGASAEWVLRKTPRTEFFVEHRRDMDQLGMMGLFDQGNGLNSALQLNDQTRLTEITRSEISFLHEFGSGWGQSAEFRHRKVAPRGEVLFVRSTDTTGLSPLVTAELTLQTRYARNEKFLTGAFERISLGSKWPVLTGTVTLGLPRIGGSEFSYQRWTLDAEGTKRIGPLGRIEWWSQGGMYTGLAPVVLTELQPANETSLSINEAFNLLRFMEFASDRWIRASAEWHGEGVVLNRLPLLKNLRMREVVGIKGVRSSWDPRHEAITAMPGTTTGLNGWYAEAVLGVENVFQFLRIDVHRRITPSLDGMRDPWGVRIGFSVGL